MLCVGDFSLVPSIAVKGENLIFVHVLYHVDCPIYIYIHIIYIVVYTYYIIYNIYI